MTAVDEWPSLVPWLHCPAVDIAAEVRDAEHRERLMYQLGRADGHAAGEAATERQLARHWAALAKDVRGDAARLRAPVPEPATRSNGSPDDSIWFTAAEWASWAGER